MGSVYTSGVWTVQRGQDDEFVSAWNDFVEFARELPGAGRFHLVRDVEQADRYMSFGNWESLEAQQAWKETDEFATRMRRVRQHADLTPSTWEVVSEVG
jgi:heme-degrading monooxygenase HmoA